MGPVRLILMSDQPILELVVRSTTTVSLCRPLQLRGFSGSRSKLTLVVLPFVHVLKVINTSIVVVLTREDNSIQVARVGISNRVAWEVSSRFLVGIT